MSLGLWIFSKYILFQFLIFFDIDWLEPFVACVLTSYFDGEMGEPTSEENVIIQVGELGGKVAESGPAGRLSYFNFLHILLSFICVQS